MLNIFRKPNQPSISHGDDNDFQGEMMNTRFRSLSKTIFLFVYIVGIFASLFHLYALFINPVDEWILRGAHFTLISVLIFMLIPPLKQSSKTRVSPIDILFVLLSISSLLYIILNFHGLEMRGGGEAFTTTDIVFATITVLVILEAMRRTSGNVLPVLAILFIIYALIGSNLPGLFWNKGYSFERVMSFMYSMLGIYSIPLGVSARYVFIFILFGSFLQASGAGNYFIELAQSLIGRSRGGLGKIPIISSALFGTISGAAVANVVVTGSITIPAMKKGGFSAKVAGAIEAVAATGGQIMPPVMGAAAFLMAEVLGISYSGVVKAAIIPAILYYFSIYLMVDFEAAKNSSILPVKDDIPSLSSVLLSFYLFIPIIILFTLLMGFDFSPNKAALVAIFSAIVISWFNKANKIDFKKIFDILYNTARGLIEIAPTCAGAGIIIGILSLTGLGLKAANIILGYSGGNLYIALFLSMLICLLLGMGMPSVAAYATAAAVIPPALIKLGVTELAAHMFIFYFSILATITPPVALAAYAAASIARTSMWDVGWTAVKFGIAGFIIPYMFVFGPALLLEGSAAEIVLAIISASIGVIGLAASFQGWLLKKLGNLERLIILASSLCLIKPGLITDIIGYVLFILILLKNNTTHSTWLGWRNSSLSNKNSKSI